MPTLEQQIIDVGLTPQQTKVYLACLELGSGYASSIARRAGLARVNCYYALNQLRALGLVSATKRNEVLVFVPENPKKIVNIASRKLQAAEKLLPDLLAITNSLAYKPIIRFYEGREGVQTIYDDILTAKKEVLGYTNLKAAAELYPEFLKNHCAEKVRRKIKTRIISSNSKIGSKFPETFFPKNFDRNLLEIFFVNPVEFDFLNEIAIYNNKTAIISLDRREIFGILIESTTYTQTQKAIYNLAWLGATSFVAQ